MICRLPGPAVEKSAEILREASTALKSSQRLYQSSFFVVEELHLAGVLCGEPRLENHAEIVGRGVGRARLKLLDEQLGGFRRDREVPLVDRHDELLGDEPRLLEVARQLVGRARRLSAARGDVASPKLAASLIAKAADPKTPPVTPGWPHPSPSRCRHACSRSSTPRSPVFRCWACGDALAMDAAALVLVVVVVEVAGLISLRGYSRRR